jgi:predicted GIY-YIG superfamily endonuclease
MTVYLIHTASLKNQTYHYIGFTRDGREIQRLHEHAGSNGARSLRRNTSNGDILILAKTWKQAPPEFERKLKNRHANARLCPLCNPNLPQSTLSAYHHATVRRVAPVVALGFRRPPDAKESPATTTKT